MRSPASNTQSSNSASMDSALGRKNSRWEGRTLPNKGIKLTTYRGTVDGRNPAQVDMVNIPLFIQGFIHPRWCRISYFNSMSAPYRGIVLYVGLCLFFWYDSEVDPFFALRDSWGGDLTAGVVT